MDTDKDGIMKIGDIGWAACRSERPRPGGALRLRSCGDVQTARPGSNFIASSPFNRLLGMESGVRASDIPSFKKQEAGRKPGFLAEDYGVPTNCYTLSISNLPNF